MTKSMIAFNLLVVIGFLMLGIVQVSQQKQLDKLSSSVDLILGMTVKQLSEIDTRETRG